MNEAVFRRPVDEAAPKLVLVAGAERSEYELGRGGTSLGRSASADVSLDDPLISRLHCRIACLERGWEVVDLHSQNGTWVNGVRVRKCGLRHGDQVRIGAFTFYFSETGDVPHPADLDIIQPAMTPEPWFEPAASPIPPPSRTDDVATSLPRTLRTCRPAFLRAAGLLLLFILALLVWMLVDSDESAEEEFQRIFQTELNAEARKQVESYRIDAEAQIAQGNAAAALEQYQRVLVLDPGNPVALSESARLEDQISKEAEQRAAAIEEERQAAARVAELVEEADGLVEKGDMSEARALLREALGIDPESEVIEARLVSSHVTEGERLERRGLTARARAQFQTALALDPGNVEARRGHDRILAVSRQARERKDQVASLMETGSAQMERGQLEEAYATFSAVLEIQPDHAEARSGRARAEEGLVRKTQPVYEEAVRLYREGDRPRAVAKLREARALYPEHEATRAFLNRVRGELTQEAEDLYKRAYIYEGLGRLHDALEYYRKALALLPDPEAEYYRKASEKVEDLKRKTGEQ